MPSRARARNLAALIIASGGGIENPPEVAVESDIEAARESVVEAWLEAGFNPEVYFTSFDAVRAGAWDDRMPVQIALAAFRRGAKR